MAEHDYYSTGQNTPSYPRSNNSPTTPTACELSTTTANLHHSHAEDRTEVYIPRGYAPWQQAYKGRMVQPDVSLTGVGMVYDIERGSLTEDDESLEE